MNYLCIDIEWNTPDNPAEQAELLSIGAACWDSVSKMTRTYFKLIKPQRMDLITSDTYRRLNLGPVVLEQAKPCDEVLANFVYTFSNRKYMKRRDVIVLWSQQHWQMLKEQLDKRDLALPCNRIVILRDILSYQSNPEAMNAAMEIGWTQNVVIIEADLARDERMWYIRAARKFDWSKLTLTEKIKACVHMQLDLDTGTESCYTDSIETMEEAHDESALCVPREYLQKPDGRVCDEGYGGESGAEPRVPRCVRGNYHRRDWKPCLSPRLGGSSQSTVSAARARRRGCCAGQTTSGTT